MSERKIVINIGRQIGSGGRLVARTLADRFGCKLYDRELLNLAAKESGFCEKFFVQNDEHKGFFRSVFHTSLPFGGGTCFYGNDFSQESLFKFQSDAIRKAADEGSCVFVGRCADYVLRDRKDMVSVFITANMSERLAMVMERTGCDEAKARKIITGGESERASYYKYYTGKVWGHSSSYDLCINSSLLGLDGTADMIEAFIRKTLNL